MISYVITSNLARHAILRRWEVDTHTRMHHNSFVCTTYIHRRINIKIVRYSLHKLLCYSTVYTDKSIRLSNGNRIPHTQTVHLLLSFLENQFLIPSAEKVLRCILGPSRLLFGPRGMANLDTSSQLFAFNNPEP